MKTYILRGKPIPLKRPRFSTALAPHAYNPQKVLKEEAMLELVMQHGSNGLLKGPILLEITFFMQIPASYSKKKKSLLSVQKHSCKPDLSNLIKWVEDVAQGILFLDDSQITTIRAEKVYGDVPRTEFKICKDFYEKNS